MVLDAKRRLRSGTANALSPNSSTPTRPKTDRSRNSSSWLSRSTPQTPRLGPSSLSQQASSEKHDDLTDSTEFLGLSDEDDPDPEILEHFLRSGTDPSCPMSVQRGRIWKAKTEALRRVNALLGENEDLLQSDPQVGALPCSTVQPHLHWHPPRMPRAPPCTDYALTHHTFHPTLHHHRWVVIFSHLAAVAEAGRAGDQGRHPDIHGYAPGHRQVPGRRKGIRYLADERGRLRE
jgi:hypothetical protein